jgi:hypothetical protein
VSPAELERMMRAVDPAVAEASLVSGIAQAAGDDWKAAVHPVAQVAGTVGVTPGSWASLVRHFKP